VTIQPTDEGHITVGGVVLGCSIAGIVMAVLMGLHRGAWSIWDFVIGFVLAAAPSVAALYRDRSFYRIWQILRLQKKGVQLAASGELEKSEKALRKALSLAEAHWDEANTAHVLLNLAVTLVYQQRWQEAEAYGIRALETFRKHQGPTATMVAAALDTLTEISAGKKDYEAADVYFRELDEILHQEETHPELGNPELRDFLREKVTQLNLINEAPCAATIIH
jgi:tetratricopeptide (TPR) repeat protein